MDGRVGVLDSRHRLVVRPPHASDDEVRRRANVADDKDKLAEATALLEEAHPYLATDGYGYTEDAQAIAKRIQKFLGKYVTPGSQQAKEMEMTWQPYSASETGQMRFADEQTTDTSLKIHELRPDGLPRCGPKLETSRWGPLLLVPLGPGKVTCGSCARITDR